MMKNLKSGMKKVTIADVATVVTGKTPPTSRKDYYGGPFLFVAPGDLGKRKYIRHSEKTLTDTGRQHTPNIPKGSILFTCIGATIGKIGIADKNLSTNQQINSVIPKGIDSEYLYYMLDCIGRRIKQNAGVQAVPIVTKSEFEKQPLMIHSDTKTQKTISDLLSTWDIAIEKTEALITVKEQQFNWLLNNLIEYRTTARNLGSVCAHVKGEKYLNHDVNFKYLEIGDVDVATKGYYIDNKTKSAVLGAVKVPKNTLLISTVRPTRGAITKTQSKLYVSPAFCRLKINNDFYFYCVQQSRFANHLRARQSGATYPTVKDVDILTYKVPVLPIDEQIKIAHTLNTARCEIDLLIRLVKQYRTQIRGLMQQLLSATWRMKS